jgi:cysteine desulfurase
VIDAVAESMRCHTANPSAAYSAAGEGRKALRQARELLSRAIGCDRAELFFTSGGTEANNWAFEGVRGKHVVVSAIEHSSVLEAARARGCRVSLVMSDANGVITPEAVEQALQPDTALISVQLINNETGVVHPVGQIGKLARSRRILYHCDAVQAFGHIPLNVKTICADLLSASGHKLYGPRGAGFLYVRSGVQLPALISGGGQENGRRSGTENIPAIAGFRVAAELALADLEERAARERGLVAQLTEALCTAIPGAKVLGEHVDRAPGVCAVLLPGLSSEYAIAQLDLMGIQVSGGAACAARLAQPSHVYRAMGLGEPEAACVLRFSPGRSTTTEEIRAAADAVIEVYHRRR